MTGHNTTLTPSGTNIQDLMREFGVAEAAWNEGGLIVRSPVNGAAIAEVKLHAQADVDRAIHAADAAFQIWRAVPAPKRGELVRLFAEELRVRKTALGRLVAIESGKILQEGLGEVQEMIDICSFAAGLSRQLYGRTIASERPGHRMMETWHPLGVVGIISAFNFPVAVWAWNAAIALVCGDTLVWKPSEKTPLCALACQALLDRAAKGLEGIPPGLSAVILGGPELGQALAGNPLVPLVSATGSTRMGRAVAPRIAERFGRSILELGGTMAPSSRRPPISTLRRVPFSLPPWAPQASAAPACAASSCTKVFTINSCAVSKRTMRRFELAIPWTMGRS